MPLSLKMQAKEIALYDVKPGDEQGQKTLLGKVDLDFEVSPIALASEDGYHRLLAALAQFRADSEVTEVQVDLVVPAEWGVTHSVPDPSLSGEELSEHLQWELRKSLVDSEEKFRYNFAYAADGGIALAAMRISLLTALQQVVEEAGFQLSGMFLEGEPWRQVNLVRRDGVPEDVPRAEEVEKAASPEKKPKTKPIHPRRSRRTQPSWFFGIVLVLGLIVVSYFIWTKLSPPLERAVVEEPVAAVAEEPVAGTEEVSTQPTQAERVPVAPPIPGGAWTGMEQRFEIVQETMSILGDQNYFDLISFTDKQFLCQISSEEIERLNAAISRISNLSVLEEVKSQSVPPYNGTVRGVVSGKVSAGSMRVGTNVPRKEGIIAIGKQHELKNEALVFTGSKAAVMNFISELAASNYAIYRFILVPWETDEYRAVLEF